MADFFVEISGSGLWLNGEVFFTLSCKVWRVVGAPESHCGGSNLQVTADQETAQRRGSAPEDSDRAARKQTDARTLAKGILELDDTSRLVTYTVWSEQWSVRGWTWAKSGPAERPVESVCTHALLTRGGHSSTGP